MLLGICNASRLSQQMTYLLYLHFSVLYNTFQFSVLIVNEGIFIYSLLVPNC